MSNKKILSEQLQILDKYTDDYNKSELELVRQLIFIDTIFLSLSPLLLLNPDFISSLGFYGQLFVFIGWASFIVSLAVGVLIYQKDITFFGSYYESQVRVVNYINDNSDATEESIYEYIELEDDIMPRESVSWRLRLTQILTTALGVLAITVTIFFSVL